MKDVFFFLLFELLSTLAKLTRPGGSRSVIAKSLLLKRQVIIHGKSRQRATNLNTPDRALLCFMSLFLAPRPLKRAATIIKPSILLFFHSALKKRKYRLLYSPRGGRKPGPKRPSREVINAIVEMKQSNSRYGCPRVAEQINLAFGLELDKDTVRRVLAIHHKPHSGMPGTSWLTTPGQAKDSLKSLPHVPMSPPFVERLIVIIRRELLDQTLFWTATDLEKKVQNYQRHHREHRCHSNRYGATPDELYSRHDIDIRG